MIKNRAASHWQELERYGAAGPMVYGEAAIAPRLAPVLASASYVVMIAVIVVNEATLARWRNERGKALGETYAPLGL